MINFFTKLLTPVFIALGLVNPTPVAETPTPDTHIQQELIELRQEVQELEVENSVEEVPQPEIEIRDPELKIVEVKKEPIIPTLVTRVDTPVSVVTNTPETIENLDIQCSRHIHFDFDEIQEKKEFYLKLTPNYGKMSDYRVSWDSNHYEGKFQETEDIFRFKIYSRGVYRINFSAEIRETGERKDFKCMVEVFREKKNSDDKEDNPKLSFIEERQMEIEEDIKRIINREYDSVENDNVFGFTLEERLEMDNLLEEYRVYNQAFNSTKVNSIEKLDEFINYWNAWIQNKYNKAYSVLD